MNHVIGVSWPGSGHRLLVGMLRDYFGPVLRYSRTAAEISRAPQKEGELSLLGNDGIDLFGLQAANLKYLIQYRSFESWVVSAYDKVLAGTSDQTDSFETFTTFVSRNFTPYRSFMDRWVNPEISQNQLVLSYEQLVHYPLESLQLAIRWLDKTHEIDQPRLNGIISSLKVRPQSSLEDFRYYDPEFFNKIRCLSLTREEVSAVCLTLLGREPTEKTWLSFQCHSSIRKMAQIIRDSFEYKNRVQAGL